MGADLHSKQESHSAAIGSIAETTARTRETLRKWMRQDECNLGRRAGPTSEDCETLKPMEGENAELRRAHEILRKVSAHFTNAEFDGRGKNIGSVAVRESWNRQSSRRPNDWTGSTIAGCLNQSRTGYRQRLARCTISDWDTR